MRGSTRAGATGCGAIATLQHPDSGSITFGGTPIFADPAERNRLYNVLSDAGEQGVVILSTHIVEDVRQLDRRMAIVAQVRVI